MLRALLVLLCYSLVWLWSLQAQKCRIYPSIKISILWSLNTPTRQQTTQLWNIPGINPALISWRLFNNTSQSGDANRYSHAFYCAPLNSTIRQAFRRLIFATCPSGSLWLTSVRQQYLFHWPSALHLGPPASSKRNYKWSNLPRCQLYQTVASN